MVFAVGYLLFVVLLGDFYAANGGSATGVMRDPQIVWAGAVSALAYAALILYALRANVASLNVTTGAKVGETVGFLLWLSADFTIYSITNMNNLTVTVLDPFVEAAHGGTAGAVLAVL